MVISALWEPIGWHEDDVAPSVAVIPTKPLAYVIAEWIQVVPL